jgi:hypothetical protein
MPKSTKNLSLLILDFLLSFIASLVISLAMALFQPAPFFSAWFGANLLFWLSFFLLLRLWRYFKGGKALATLMLVTFLTRLLLGVFINTALPAIGYDNAVENAGYVYSDAYQRDSQALALASSDEPLRSAFGDDSIDQYGGLMFLSAMVYRLFSVDVARPLFITILASFIMTAGLAFLFDAIRRCWGDKVALIACWFYAVYPEGVLLGSSQMREPFLIGLFCVAFWTLITWREKIVKKIIMFIFSIVFSLLISVPYGAMLTGLLIAFWLVEWISNQPSRTLRRLGLLALAVMGTIGAIAGWLWLKPTLYYDAYLTRINSGIITAILNMMGDKWQMPFLTIYGIVQPFLPGALTDPSLPFWQTTAIIRALGWWFVLPFLPYGFFALWKVKPKSERWGLLIIILSLFVWILVSALRAGGDLWDNPRYRALLIPWFALLVGWCWQRLRAGYWAWFLRWVGVVLVFFVVFFLWYLLRYKIISEYLSFYGMIKTILAAWALILLTGLRDVVKWIKKRKGNIPAA